LRAKSVYESEDFMRGRDPKASLGIGNVSFAERIKRARFAYPERVEFVGFDSFEGRGIYIYKILKSMNKGIDDNYYFVIPLSYDYLDDKETLSYFYARSQNSKTVAGADDRLGREIGERYLARKRDRIQEGLDFERGKDPKSSMDIGLSNVIYNKWDELQSESGIGSINIEKSLNSVWHLVVYVGQFPDSASEGFKKVQKYFADYLSPFYNKKGGELKIKILPEYTQAFIDAYNMRYPAWTITITEGIDFQRSYSKGDIIDRLTDNIFRKGRLFVYKRKYFDNSHKVLSYIGESESKEDVGIFHTVGVFMNLKKGASYAFYAPGLLYGSDKRTLLAKETVRPLNKEEIQLYLERKNNPSEKFIKHLEEVKKIIGVEPFL